MRFLLTGGTGHVGSAILQRLIRDGHEVTAVVRSPEAAAQLDRDGVRPVIGDLTDSEWLAAQLADVDGMVHTANPMDATTPAFDRAIVDCVIATFGDSGKPYVHSSSVWNHGAGTDVTEASPIDPPPTHTWRPAIDRLVVEAPGIRGSVILIGAVHGHGGGGYPRLIASAPTLEEGSRLLIGDGTQHIAAVHVDDLADLFVLALDRGRGPYIGAGADNPTVRELIAAAAGPGVALTPEEPTATVDRFGPELAAGLLLDQQTRGMRAREELGWEPRGETMAAGLAAVRGQSVETTDGSEPARA